MLNEDITNDIEDIFDDKDEEKINSLVDNNCPYELKNLIFDLVSFINKIKMDIIAKNQFSKKLDEFQKVLASLLSSVKEDNSKFKEEMKNKESKLNQEIKKMNLKQISMEAQIDALKKDSTEKGKKIDNFVLKFKDIYERLLCSLEFYIIKTPLVNHEGIIYDEESLFKWRDRKKKEHAPLIDPLTHKEMDLNKLYPCKELEHIIPIC